MRRNAGLPTGPTSRRSQQQQQPQAAVMVAPTKPIEVEYDEFKSARVQACKALNLAYRATEILAERGHNEETREELKEVVFAAALTARVHIQAGRAKFFDPEEHQPYLPFADQTDPTIIEIVKLTGGVYAPSE